MQRSPEEDRSLTWTESCMRLNVGLENDASHLHSSQIFDQNSPKKVKDKVKVGLGPPWGLGPFRSFGGLRSQEAAQGRLSLGSAMKPLGPNPSVHRRGVGGSTPGGGGGRRGKARVSSRGLRQPSSPPPDSNLWDGGDSQAECKHSQSLGPRLPNTNDPSQRKKPPDFQLNSCQK